MTSPADTYNYQAFSFALEHDAFEGFLRDAPRLGRLAPNFELPDLEGRHHRLADWRGQPVVVEFGSYTCPIFCGHVPAMAHVAAAHPEAAFVVVYTREAHPGERIPAHATVADKSRCAHRLVHEHKVGRLVLVDDLDGTVHRAYGTGWDTMFVVDAGGTVVLRRAWNRPAEVADALTALRAGERVRAERAGERVRAESVEMAPPADPAGFGDGLLRGGRQALLDFYQSAPPGVREQLEASTSPAVRNLIATLAATSRYLPSPLSPLTNNQQEAVMQFIVTGRAIDGLPMPPEAAIGAYRATFELLASGSDPHIKGVWPHAEERATTLLVEADTAEKLGDTLTALPGFMLSTWEAHAVTSAAHVAEALGRMEAAVGA